MEYVKGYKKTNLIHVRFLHDVYETLVHKEINIF